MKIRFFNIVWDTDGEEVNLPSDIILEVSDDLDVEEEGADVLSDEHGFLVQSFSWEAPPA